MPKVFERTNVLISPTSGDNNTLTSPTPDPPNTMDLVYPPPSIPSGLQHFGLGPQNAYNNNLLGGVVMNSLLPSPLVSPMVSPANSPTHDPNVRQSHTFTNRGTLSPQHQQANAQSMKTRGGPTGLGQVRARQYVPFFVCLQRRGISGI